MWHLLDALKRSSTPSIHSVSWRSPSRSPVLAKASHRDTKTRRKVPAHRSAVALFALFSALSPSLPLMSPFGLPSAGLVRIPPGTSHPSGCALCSLPHNRPVAWFPASAHWHVFRFASFAPSQPTQANPSPASSSCVHVRRIQAHRSRA